MTIGQPRYYKNVAYATQKIGGFIMTITKKFTYAPTHTHKTPIHACKTLHGYKVVNPQPFASYSIALQDLYKTAIRMCVNHCYRHSINQPRLYDIVTYRFTGEAQNFDDLVQETVVGMWRYIKNNSYIGACTSDYGVYKKEVIHAGYKALNNYCQSIRGINSRIDTAHKTVYIEDITRNGDIVNVTGDINRTIKHGEKLQPVDTVTGVCYNIPLINQMLTSVLPTLTPTQAQILKLMCLNYSADNINDKQGYARRNKTAQKHIRAIRKAFQCFLTENCLTFDNFTIINKTYTYTDNDLRMLHFIKSLQCEN